MVINHYSGLVVLTSQKCSSNSASRSGMNDTPKGPGRNLVMFSRQRIKQSPSGRPFNRCFIGGHGIRSKPWGPKGILISWEDTQIQQYFLSRFLCSLLYGAFEKQVAALRSQLQMKSSQALFSPGIKREQRTESRRLMLCRIQGWEG